MTRQAETSRERDMSFTFSFLIKWSQVSLRMRRSSHKSRQRRSLKKHVRSEMTPASPLFKGAKSKGTAVLEKSKLTLVGQVKPNSDLGP